jgi:ABC-2 type transport system ATP-binding protein
VENGWVFLARAARGSRGPLESVLGGSDGPVTRVRAEDAVRLAGALRQKGMLVEPDGSALMVRNVVPKAVGAVAAEHGIALLELVAVSRSLEDAFFELTAEAPA